MKRTFKLLCVMLLVCLLIVPTSISVSAEIPERDEKMGDVNLDLQVNVKDATLIQKSTAQTESLTSFQLTVADVDEDGAVSVKDATLIQKVQVGLADYDEVVKPVAQSLRIDNVFVSKAIVGSPVTVDVRAVGSPGPLMYEYLINGQVVKEKSESSIFEYTFAEEGDNYLVVNVYNYFGLKSVYTDWIYVREELDTDKPYIYNVWQYEKNVVDFVSYGITVVPDVKFGTAPYEYKFEQYLSTNDEAPILTQDFSDDIGFLLSDVGLDTAFRSHDIVKITVRDAKGAESTLVYKAER